MENDKCIQILIGKSEDHLEDTEVGGIILKWILRE
jgi:hypothetical protein